MVVSVGRNDPCPCGSGLKVKSCCETGRASAPGAAPIKSMPSRTSPSAETAYRLGAELFAGGRLAEAVVNLERSLALKPSFEAPLRILANAYEHLGRELEAASAYRRLARATRDPQERRLFLAQALDLEGASDEAEVELRRAIAAAPGNARARVIFGQHLLQRGAFAEAEPLLLGAIDQFPDVFQHLASSRPFTDADRPLLERVSVLADRGDLGPLQRGAIHFGLGKAHDDLGDYAEAMRQFEAANAFCGQSRALDRAGLAALYDELIATASAIPEPRRGGGSAPTREDDLPILIVGMPRSGTTLVEQILSSHPDVAAGGELPFWSDRVKQWVAHNQTVIDAPIKRWNPLVNDLLTSRPPRSAVEQASRVLRGVSPSGRRSASPEALSEAARDYLELLRGIGPRAQRVIDKAPFNFERLAQIRAALPEIRIVHCRRDAADTCLSIFFTNYKGRQAWTRSDLLFQYRQYQRLMEHWRSTLRADRFIEVGYEDVVADREGQTRRLITFCGLEWSDACLAPQENRRVVRSASLWQARQPTYTRSVKRWRRYEPWLGELSELLVEGA